MQGWPVNSVAAGPLPGGEGLLPACHGHAWVLVGSNQSRSSQVANKRTVFWGPQPPFGLQPLRNWGWAPGFRQGKEWVPRSTSPGQGLSQAVTCATGCCNHPHCCHLHYYFREPPVGKPGHANWDSPPNRILSPSGSGQGLSWGISGVYLRRLFSPQQRGRRLESLKAKVLSTIGMS